MQLLGDRFYLLFLLTVEGYTYGSLGPVYHISCSHTYRVLALTNYTIAGAMTNAMNALPVVVDFTQHTIALLGPTMHTLADTAVTTHTISAIAEAIHTIAWTIVIPIYVPHISSLLLPTNRILSTMHLADV
jgi:hypothetical protein